MTEKRPLPAQATSFVGRSAELTLLQRTFERGARLVTLLGPPGIGKSRLALRYAELRQAEKAYRGGAYVCDLVEAASVEDVCAALAGTIDAAVGDARRADRVAELGARLAELGDVLLVLDNFEHLVGHGPATIARWLELAPRARMLLTSRERLRLAGEVIVELGPLSLPEDADVARAEAVTLFIERARAVRPSFAVSPDNAASVAAIVRQLDGIPLAIELGASRMGVLSPAKLLTRMARRFDVLSAGIRNAAARQRTLREAIDTSWSMLEPSERAALAQLSVFRGGFTLEAAEAVVDLGDQPGAPSLLDVVSSLADKSWLFTRCPAAQHGEVRFGMYLSLRDYAAARLEEAGHAPEVAARHAAYFLRAMAEEDAAGDSDLIRRALERENLIATHKSLLASPSPSRAAAEGALRAALALEGVLIRWGPVPALVTMLGDALARVARVSPSLKAHALAAKAGALQRLGRLDESRADYDAALSLARKAGDGRMEGIAAAGIGAVLREQGRMSESRRWLAQAIARLRAAGARRDEARARNELGTVHIVTGRVVEARAQYEAALRVLSVAGDRELRASTQMNLALLDIAEGRLEEAAARLKEARAWAPEPLLPASEAALLRGLALLRQEQGLLEEARASAEASISIERLRGSRRAEGFTLGHLGTILVEVGDLVQARAALERATELVREAGDARGDAMFTAILGAVRARLGHVTEATRLFERVDERLRGVGDRIIGTAIDLYRAELDLAVAAASGEARAAAVAAAAVERRIVAARSPAGAQRSPAERSHHVRTALRVLGARAAGPPAPAPPAGKALVISPDGRWCRLPSGGEVVFKRGRALRLMLLRLFEERLRSPGRALPLDALFESGWPGERASPDALGNRVYVGISRLRKLGFQGLLLSRDDGFLLDPAVPSYRAERPAADAPRGGPRR